MSDESGLTALEIAAEAERTADEVKAANSSTVPVVVYTAGTAEDGEIVRGILESEGIPVILTTPASPAYGDAFGLAVGQAGQVLVAPEDVQRAMDILEVTSASELVAE